MLKIDNCNNIFLTKGDTATINVEVFDNDGYQYTIQSTDEIKLGVKSKSSTVLSKTATNGVIILNPSDTSSLTAGIYKYDIQLKTANNNVYTIIPLSEFHLIDEVAQ